MGIVVEACKLRVLWRVRRNGVDEKGGRGKVEMCVDYLLSSLRPLMSLMRGPFTGALSYREKNERKSPALYYHHHHDQHLEKETIPVPKPKHFYYRRRRHHHRHSTHRRAHPGWLWPKGFRYEKEIKGLQLLFYTDWLTGKLAGKQTVQSYSFQTCDRLVSRSWQSAWLSECDERFMTCFHDTSPEEDFYPLYG